MSLQSLVKEAEYPSAPRPEMLLGCLGLCVPSGPAQHLLSRRNGGWALPPQKAADGGPLGQPLQFMAGCGHSCVLLLSI